MNTTVTAKSLRAEITKAEDAGREEFAAVRAIEELRAKVARLKRASQESPTVEECRTAARELVAASQDLQAAEIVEPMERAAAQKASARVTDAAQGVLRSIRSHFEKLKTEAFDLAHEIATELVDPSAREPFLRADQNQGGRDRNNATRNMAGFAMGGYAAHQVWRTCDNVLGFDAKSAARNNAEALIDDFDATTAQVQAQIAKLRRVLSVLRDDGSKAKGGGGIGAVPATTPEEEPLAVSAA